MAEKRREALRQEVIAHPGGAEVSGTGPSPAQGLAVPPRFSQCAGHYSQCAQRTAVIVQFGRPIRDPADQPDIEFIVAVQAREPAVVDRRPAGGQQVAVVAREHIVGVVVGGLQQVRQPQAGRGRNSGDGRRQHSRLCGTQLARKRMSSAVTDSFS